MHARSGASCVIRYNDLTARGCLRCNYPRPLGPIEPEHACSECGLRPVDKIRPPLRWLCGSVVLHSIEFVILVLSGLFCISLASLFDTRAYS